MDKYCLLTNDVETHSIWFNTLRDETGIKVLKEGMPVLLDIYQKYDIKTTFFFTGYIAEKFPAVVKMILPHKHEVASHGYSHEVDQALDILPYKKQVEHLRKSKQLLEDISGQEVITFRAPALRVNTHTPLALAETGYRIDSSIPSQRFDFFLSFGSLRKLKWLLAPRLPYFTKENDLARKGKGKILEVPLSAFFFPYVSTTMRIFPRLTKIQRHLLNMESSINKKPIVFDIHPNEIIEEKKGKRSIERRTANFFKYLLSDVLRGKLKTANLGRKAIPLYISEIEFFKKKNYGFVTIRDFCKKNHLI